MAETINNKPSIQIRSGLPSPLPDKSPSPATKLLISHGKPNFTISKSAKGEENGNALSPQPSATNNYNAYKSANSNVANNNNNKFIVGTKFNGVFKPSNGTATWATNGNGNGTSDGENEASKVVLRRPKLAESPTPADSEDADVPEFIRRQRRIQERLAKENVLDFENRRSGYFTHVMISPDSPNRTSFVETMASPAIVPALEIPAPVAEKVEEEKEQEPQPVVAAVVTSALITEPEPEPVTNGHSEEVAITNGHSKEESSDVAPEEVAKAIEEVNKAVAGEEEAEVEAAPEPAPVAVPESAPVAAERKAEPELEAEAVEAAPVAVAPTSAPAPVEAQVEVVEPAAPATNGQKEEETPATNGHKEEEEAITISHTNGQTNGHSSDGPSIPSPDPSGALGVNYEPKTVVSFSQELGGGENNYPDTVKVVTEGSPSQADGELKELAKLKFDIKSDEQNDDVQVTPALRAE
ncbi:E3 ubiquitin-protein ligase RNF12-B [Drosophila kikkawai]|uniref:E3 ubiquitin-protein ligase RNF12-B n=1 Tax=Drosophila kikkawai TaxID=30033 RepID=A0A6P4IWT6_DROKI|nr:A-kinase anchor protein 200 [Drosophila kikkawai]XP_017027834.1 A-kinase anchor protein 200 [Drosophila kikkawai]